MHRMRARWTEVQIGVVDRPAAMLDRLGASLDARLSPIIAHAECLHLD